MKIAMKRTLLFIYIFFISLKLISQPIEYQMAPEVTSKIIVKYKNAFWLNNAKREVLDLPIYDTTYVETEEFLRLTKNLDKLKQDSIKLEEDYLLKLSEYNGPYSIITLIDEFLGSSEKFKDKKRYLLEAQNKAEKYEFNFLIFANKSVNSDRRAEYFRLKLDVNDFNIHLRKIQNQIGRKLYKPSRPSNNSYSDLNKTRARLLNTPKLEPKYIENGSSQVEVIVLADKIDDLTTISGTLYVVGDYRPIIKKKRGFVLNQLVSEDFIESQNLQQYSGNQESLIKDANTGTLYFGTSRFLYNCGTDMTLVRFSEKLTELGYKSFIDGDDIIITTTSGNLILTHDIFKNVNEGNVSYIDEIAKSVQEFNYIVSQAKPLQAKLVNHFSAYQHATLSSTRLNQWKSDVHKAQKLFDKAHSLKGREFSNIEYFQKQIELSKIKQFTEFTEVLKGCKVVLGM